jgi:hypothetical protein
MMGIEGFKIHSQNLELFVAVAVAIVILQMAFI